MAGSASVRFREKNSERRERAPTAAGYELLRIGIERNDILGRISR